ncbi:hypothetical protein OROHE_022304 [Orobanche hederae]
MWPFSGVHLVGVGASLLLSICAASSELRNKSVCQKCPLNESCKLANKKCKNYTQLDLAKVMRVLIMYAMESVPHQLAVPEDVNASVSRLLKEIVNLNRTTS